MKMKKIKLSDIKVKSFVTAISAKNHHEIKGGTSEDTTIPTRHESADNHADCSHFCFGSHVREKFL